MSSSSDSAITPPPLVPHLSTKRTDDDDKLATIVAVVLGIVALAALLGWGGAQRFGNVMAEHTRMVKPPQAAGVGLAGALGAGATVVAPVASAETPAGPILTVGKAADGTVTVNTVVPTDADKSRLMGAATMVFGAGVIDQVTVDGSKAALNWNSNPLDVFAKLKHFETFNLQVNPKDVSLTGTTAVPEVKTAVEGDVGVWFGRTGKADISMAVAPAGAPAVAAFDANSLFNVAVQFESGKADLTEAATAELKPLAEALKGNTGKINIIGHTDDAGLPGPNKALSLSRANKVREFLIAQGVDGSNLVALGLGEEKPIADNATPEGKQKNRRIEFSRAP